LPDIALAFRSFGVPLWQSRAALASEEVRSGEGGATCRESDMV